MFVGGGAWWCSALWVAGRHAAGVKLQDFPAHNPLFLQLTERNPELAHLLNNPELLRESMRLMSNPVSRSGDRDALLIGAALLVRPLQL